MPQKLSEQDRKNHNRAIVVLIIALFSAAWVMINAGQLLLPGVMYIVIVSISIFLYFIWNKF